MQIEVDEGCGELQTTQRSAFEAPSVRSDQLMVILLNFLHSSASSAVFDIIEKLFAQVGGDSTCALVTHQPLQHASTILAQAYVACQPASVISAQVKVLQNLLGNRAMYMKTLQTINSRLAVTPAAKSKLESQGGNLFQSEGLLGMKIISDDIIDDDIEDKWVSTWVKLDRKSKTISVYENGPGSMASLQLLGVGATLVVPSLTVGNQQLEFVLDGCKSNLSSSSLKVALKCEKCFDYWRWVGAFSTIVETFQCDTSNRLQFVSLSLNHPDVIPLALTGAISRSMQDNTSYPLYLQNFDKLLLKVVECLVERKMTGDTIRTVRALGHQIKTAKFTVLNGRLIVSAKGSCDQFIEGSVIVSVNGISAMSMSASTVLKFIADLPRQMLVDVVLWRFPRAQFRCSFMELQPVEGIEIQRVSHDNDSIPSAPLQTPSKRAANKLDGASTNLSQILIKKRQSILSIESVNSTLNESTKKESIREVPDGNLPQDTAVKMLTSCEFLSNGFNSDQWMEGNILIASGNLVVMKYTKNTPSNVALYRFQLGNMRIRLLYPRDATGSSSLNLEVADSSLSIVLRCTTSKIFFDLLESLVFALKLFGVIPCNLSEVYDRSMQRRRFRINRRRATSSVGSGKTYLRNSLLVKTLPAISQNSKSIASKTFTIGLRPSSTDASDNSAGVLQAAEDLEATLSRLRLPLHFPSAVTVENCIKEIFRSNKDNHKVLLDYLNLQVYVSVIIVTCYLVYPFSHNLSLFM